MKETRKLENLNVAHPLGKKTLKIKRLLLHVQFLPIKIIIQTQKWTENL